MQINIFSSDHIANQASDNNCWFHCTGLGLFVQGDAPVGAVIAMTPGIMYSRTQLTHMPNYPKVCVE